MSSTGAFVKSQWHSTAHFPHTETVEKNPGKPWRKSKQAFSCCLGKKQKKKNHNTFHAKLRGFSPPSGHKEIFYTTPETPSKENPVFLQVECHEVKNGKFPQIHPQVNTHTDILSQLTNLISKC